MIIRKTIYSLFLVILLIPINTSIGQSLLLPSQETVSNTDTLKKQINPIPLNNINNVSTEAFNLFTKATSDVLTPSEHDEFTNRADSIVSNTRKFFTDTAGMDFENLNFRELEILGNSLILLKKDISNLESRLNQRLKALQKDEVDLQNSRLRWKITKEENTNEETPEAIQRRIANVLLINDSVLQVLQSDIDFLLTQADKLTSQQIKIDQFESDLESYSRISSSKVFQREMPPIWDYLLEEDTVLVSGQWEFFKSNFSDDSSVLIREYSNRLVLILCIFVFLVLLVFWLRATVKDPQIKGRKIYLSLYVNEVFQKPIEVVLLIGLYFILLIIPEIPTSYSSLLAIVSVYAIIRLAYDILPQGYKKFLFGFAIAFILFRFYNLFYDQSLFSRLLLLVAQVIALVYVFIFMNVRRQIYVKKRNTFNYFISIISIFYFFFLIIALIGNVIGALSLSEYLSSGIIRSGFLIITTYVGFHISSAVIYLVLNSSIFKESNIVKQHSSYIFAKLYGILRLFFILSWFYFALSHFTVREVIFESVNDFLTNAILIGKASFTLMNIILFFFVIWLSIWISRIVRHILMQEVFPRVKIERGMPGTIIMLVRISLVTMGFLLAAAAAGMQLSNLTIIIGAFSVGIGFGLQNIFNNLVSGLILVFERPIKEGDIVEVNNLLGTVKKIGIRSSVVRTFAGAEVIVPNGELISNDLTNWTLSDQFRRAEVQIGVAYGSDPEIVIEILLKIAIENKRVNASPPPQAFFIDFGDSSLDFRLLAWMDQDYRFEVESELRVEIIRKLKEAGIEIPFPQRDLHLKTISEDSGKKLGGK